MGTTPSIAAATPLAQRCLIALLAAVLAAPATARTVYRCIADGVVSLSTAAEPGSRCVAHELDDNSALTPNLWGSLGVVSGTLYQRVQDGKVVYGTRALPGSTPLQTFAVQTPPEEPAHLGLGNIGKPRLKPYSAIFRAAARAQRLDEAWLRAIAHAESFFDANAVSAKGALGVMQLMPETVEQYGVTDPLSPSQSIHAAARHLRMLLGLYDNDQTLATAAYNAGVGAVARHGGIPPYEETRTYVRKVEELQARYRAALAK